MQLLEALTTLVEVHTDSQVRWAVSSLLFLFSSRCRLVLIHVQAACSAKR